MEPAPHPDLIVESGLHRAARCALTRSCSRVGNGPNADIVVSDLATEFAIEPTKDGVVLRASAAPIEIRGERPIKPGRMRCCTRATRFSCSGIQFAIEGPTTPAGERAPKARQRSNVTGRIFGFAGGMLVTAMVSVIAFSGAMPFTPPKRLAGSSYGSGPQASPPRRLAGGMAGLEAALRHHLDANGLASVTTTLQGDGSIEAAGEIAPADEGAWRATGRWFDSAAGGRVVLVDAVHVSAVVSPLTVAAVWAGSNPYVVDGDGERLFVGSVLASGWTIDAIDARHVTLRRDGRLIAVRY